MKSMKKVVLKTSFLLLYLVIGFLFLNLLNACSTNKPANNAQKNGVELFDRNFSEIHLVGTEEFRNCFFGKGHCTMLK